MIEMAPADPAVPMSASIRPPGESRITRDSQIASPIPRAISGASGPSTAPRGKLAMAARNTPGT